MINSTELISIIMPAKNASAWIEDCLDSIIQQSYSSWELIAVNDHSTDDTATIIEGFSKRYSRIKFYQNTGEGIIDALNTALSHANGHWITRMDADDIMPIKKIETLAKTLNWNTEIVATGKVKYFSEKPISKGYLEYEAWLNERIDRNDHWDWIYRECVVSSANWLTHRENVKFIKDQYPEDYALTFSWHQRGLRIQGSDSITHLWREHQKRTSRNSYNYQQEAFFKLKIRQFLNLSRDNKRPLVVMGNNQKSRLIGKILGGQSLPFEHLHTENFEQFSRIESPQVLVAVFPKPEERRLIEDLMTARKLTMGQDWWWL